MLAKFEFSKFKKLNYLIIGEKPTTNKLKKAKELKVEVIRSK